jgi:RHS repeat-associated protein
VTTTYTYDALHRPLTMSYSGYAGGSTPTSGFVYDDNACCTGLTLRNTRGRMVYSYTNGGTNKNSIAYYDYDAMGRIENNWQATPAVYGTTAYNLGYSYNLAGNMVGYTNGAGILFGQFFDAAGRLNALASAYIDSNHPQWLLSGIVYNAFGAPTQYDLGNGIRATLSYDTFGRLTGKSEKNGGGTGATVFNLGSITYMANSTLSSVSDNGKSRSFGYEDLDRLSGSAYPGEPNTSYTYDRFGNRFTSPSHSFDDYNHILITGAPAGGNSDALGNIWHDGLHTYTYDAENRIVAVDGGATATYVYDAFGRRVRKELGSGGSGGIYEYLYDLDGRPITTVNPAGTTLRGEIYAGSKHVATYVNNTTVFAHQDWIGSERVRTNVSGSVIQDCEYKPFGEPKSCNSTSGTFTGLNIDPFAYSTVNYAGYDRDAETGLDHLWFRYYNPRIGRFMSADLVSGSVVDPQSLNKMSYVANNPCNATDHLGLETCRFNVRVSNPANASPAQVSAALNRVNAIFAKTATSNGDHVQMNFVTSGPSSAGVEFTSPGWLVENLIPERMAPFGTTNIFTRNAYVYVERVNQYHAGMGNDNFMGSVIAHELGHAFNLGPDWMHPYNDKAPNIMMWSSSGADMSMDNANSPIWQFSREQMNDLYETCRRWEKYENWWRQSPPYMQPTVSGMHSMLFGGYGGGLAPTSSSPIEFVWSTIHYK